MIDRGPERGVVVALVDEAVRRMRQSETLEDESMLRVGEWVLDGFFAGDVAAVRDTTPKKPLSYASLVQRIRSETKTWDEDKIRRAVNAVIVARELDEAVAKKVGYSFLSRLYHVDDPAERKRLAGLIARGELERFEARMAIARESKRESRGGRRPAPEVELAVRDLERVYRKWKKVGTFERENLVGLRAAALPVSRRVRRLATALGELADGLHDVGAR